MTVRRALILSTLPAFLLCTAAASEAQQERVVGRKGAIAISLDASISGRNQTNQSFDSRGRLIEEKEFTGDYTTFVDVGRFLTDHLVLNVGTFLAGPIGGGDNAGGHTTGTQGGVRFYVTPSAAASLYVSGGGGLITSRSSGTSTSAGSVYGAGGFESALKENASIFFEGQLQRDFFEGDAQNTLRFRVGLRILF
jgi:hypothetical protein